MSSSKVFAVRALRKLLTPVLPARMRLPFRYWVDSHLGQIEEELRSLPRLTNKREVAIDVGANVGLFSYRMSKYFAKVYAFEINDGLTAELTAYNPGNIEIIPQGLSSQEGSATLFIPVLDGSPLFGWASLAPGNCPDTDVHLEKPVKIRPLDGFAIPVVSFLKIDVEGHEVEVLKGAVETLTRSRPSVLIEVKERNRSAVEAFFAGLGYREKRLEEVTGVPGSEENRYYVPGETV